MHGENVGLSFFSILHIFLADCCFILAKCYAVLKTNLEMTQLIDTSAIQHSMHSPEPRMFSYRDAVKDFKSQVNQPNTKVNSVLNEMTSKISKSVVGLSTDQAWRQIAYRARKMTVRKYKEPSSLDFQYDVEFLADFPELKCLEIIVQKDYESGKVVSRADIWAKKSSLRNLFDADIVAGDNTYRSSSPLFTSNYVIWGNSNSSREYFPCAIAFCTSEFNNFLHMNQLLHSNFNLR